MSMMKWHLSWDLKDESKLTIRSMTRTFQAVGTAGTKALQGKECFEQGGVDDWRGEWYVYGSWRDGQGPNEAEPL